MRRSTHALWSFAATGAVALLASGHALAQSLSQLHLGSWEGSLGAGYVLDREQLRSSDGTPPTDFERRRASEQLAIRNRGFFFIDPRLAAGTLGLTFDVVQDRESSGGTQDSRRATLVGYEFESVFLAAFPYSGQLFARRNQSLLTQPFGRTESAFENRGATLQLREDSPLRDWGFPYFSANMRAEQQRTTETSTSVLGQAFRREETQNNLSLDGHKGFETADLDLRYQFNDLSDAAFARASFQSHTVALNYSFDFGPTLNRRADSRVFYYARNGVSPSSLFTANESLSIDHANDLSTNYHYVLAHTDTQAGPTTSHDGSLGVRYKPFRNLDTGAQGSASHQDLSVGTRESYSGQLDVRYRHDLPWHGTLIANADGRYRVDDNSLSASQLAVLDEAHGAPSPLGAGAGFLLNQAFAIASSIVVVDLRGGARLSAALDVDYEAIAEGNLVRIVPLVTSAVIQPGDALAVSYTYGLNPSIKYSTATRSANASLNFGWINFSYGREQSNQALLSGEDNGYLQDTRKSTVKLDLRGTWKALDASAGATYDRYDSQRLAYTQQRYNGLVSWRPAYNLSLALRADRTSTEFRLPSHLTESLSTQLTLDWHLPVGLSTTGLVGRRVYQDSLQPTETINEARLGSRLSYGKLNIAASLVASERTRGGFKTRNLGLDLNMTRRF